MKDATKETGSRCELSPEQQLRRDLVLANFKHTVIPYLEDYILQGNASSMEKAREAFVENERLFHELVKSLHSM